MLQRIRIDSFPSASRVIINDVHVNERRLHRRDTKRTPSWVPSDYPPNAVEVEAFQLALPNLVSIERLIVSAQKRLDQYLKGVEKTSKASAEALRAATTKAVDAHVSGQPLAS
jgi:hypothetical protein